MSLLTGKFVKTVTYRLEFTLNFQETSKTNLKLFKYEISNSVKRLEKQLSSKANFSPFLQFNCCNFRLK